MGAEQSDSKVNEYLIAKLTKELTDYINGDMQKDSLRYIFFLMNANNFFNYDEFYSKVDIYKIADYIGDLGIIDMKEAKIIIQRILQISSCDEVATFNIQIILSKMRIKFNDSYISPLYSKDIFNQLFSGEYKTQYGRYKPTILIDWNSPDIVEGYKSQKEQTFQQIAQNMYQLNYYVKTENSERTNSLSAPVLHSEDLSSAVMMNFVERLYEKDPFHVHQGIIPLKKKIQRPSNWRKNIHIAAFQGDEASLLYCLHLLPILLNCPNDKGNTPAHAAVIGNRPNIIKLLSSFCADFYLMNNDGFLPHHLCVEKSSIVALNSAGVNLNERDARGDSLIELRTRDFNMNAIETLLGNNVNIYEPNPRGVYWMQFAMHGEFYKKEMNYLSFQKRVRKIIQKNVKKDNCTEFEMIVKQILARSTSHFENEDLIDMNDSVTNRNVNRICALLSLGVCADRIRDDGKTNLMLCAERNDHQIAEILLNNFCDPNFKNERGENTFWVASYAMNFETATVLCNHGANINEISSSGETILHVAYKERKMDLFRFLLDSGCSPNIKNKNEESVLFQAFCAKDDEVAELIQTNYNGDINTQAQDGNSLAHVALLDHDFERLNYYIRRGINIEIKNNHGYSIFMISIIMIDDLQLCSSLLSFGSDINTQDENGNTALLNILHSSKFNRNKFDFLISNNCNINIHNLMGEYPISVCIIHELNDEAHFLLNQNCVIQDTSSNFEPIACALKIKSQYWFEKLLDKGSTASNTKYPVLVNYINSDFFYFDLMKRFPSMNVIIGGPIQAAMKKGYKEVADYLWAISDEETRTEITKTPDCYGMIPLSAAIVYDNSNLANQLLSENYELMLPDSHNRTPFSYACQVNQIEWMRFLFPLITLDNANLVDDIGNSALTYSACSNNKSFCNFLFINNINIYDINADHIGIINAYRELDEKYNEFASFAFENAKESDRVFQICRDEVFNIHRAMEMRRNNSSNDSSSLLVNLISSMLSHDYYRDLEIANNKKARAEAIFNKYKERYNRLASMTRKDLLNNFALVVSLAKNDGDIQGSKRVNPDFDVDLFVSRILSIIGDD